MLGFDPRVLISLRHFFKYKKHKKLFKQLGGVITHNFPILYDYDDKAGIAKGHYFHQDLLVASFINSKNPIRHIDIGSRIDGFIAHVASFREIEVMDVRELNNSGHENIKFVKADLMNELSAPSAVTDSISCLHAIEHFGLGRYGDPIDPTGHLKGFNNILRMLKPNGTLYISFPIGKQNEIHFNAHRVFQPMDILGWANDHHKIELERFDYVDDSGDLNRNIDLYSSHIDVTYGCGIFTIKKLN